MTTQGGIRLRRAKARNDAGLPLLSVVTVVFNGERTLEETIASVLSQAYPNLEYIIVDGGSTDRTLEIVRKYEDRLDYWVSEPDSGIYDAMNKGIRLATGEWIHLLNADDRYASDDALARAIPQLDEGRTNYFPLWLEAADGHRRLHRWTYSAWEQYLAARIIHPSLVVSRNQYEQIGFYDLSYPLVADHDLVLRLSRQYPPKSGDVPLTIMRQTGTSAQNLWKACLEFRDLTIRHGMPRALAYLVAPVKYCLWKLPAGFRRFLRAMVGR